MAFLRPPSDVHRRSRTKSVVSRRSVARSRSSSGRYSHVSRSPSDRAGGDDLGQEPEDDEIFSFYLDDSGDECFLVERAFQDNLNARSRYSQATPSHLGENEEVPHLQEPSDLNSTTDRSELVDIRPKRARSSESKWSGSSSDVEPTLQKNHVHHTETKMDKRKDFTDMALRREGNRSSHDVSDAGLDRAELVIFHRDRPTSYLLDQHPKRKNFEPNVTFGCFDVSIGILAITAFFADIITDIELAAHYFRRNTWTYAGVTTGLIVCPSLVTTVLGLHWYIIDYRKERDIVETIKKDGKKAFVTPGYVWFLRFFFTLFQMGPVFRIMAYMYYGQMSRNKKLSEKQRNRYYHFMLYEDVDSCLLRLFECFLESAPQLCWQLYIAIVLKESEDVVGKTKRAIALLSSWISLAISLVSYHRSLRNSNDEKAKMGWSSVPFYFIWRASEIGGRVLCLATFASTFHFWVFGPLLFHWLFMSGWLMAQRTSFYKNTCQEKAFNVVCGYVMIFCFLNLREGTTRFRFLLFYFILYVENFFMLGFWFRFTRDLGEWYHLWGFAVILIFFVLHVVFQLLYYFFFHPTKEIKACLPCDAYIVYESLCYDLEPPPTAIEINSEFTEISMLRDSDNQANNHMHNHNHSNDVYPKVTTV